MHVALVTGGTGGIGRVVALRLMQAGLHVVVAGRDPDRGTAALSWLRTQAPQGSAELILADLSSLAEARRLARTVAASRPALSILVNNAGVFRARRTETAEGHETVLAVNHLAPFVMLQELQGALSEGARAGAPARIVTIGSSTSDRARIDPANLELRRGWTMVRAYSQSKLAVMMTTFEFARRHAASGIVANVVHPGAVATGLIRTPGIIGLVWRGLARFQRTPEQGADTPAHVALAPDWATRTGLYVKDRRAVPPNRRATDPALLRDVWDATERLVHQP